MKKKLLSLVLAVCFIIPLCFILAGCGSKPDGDNPPPPEYKILFVVENNNNYHSITFDGKSEITFPTNPTKDYFRFDGWYFDNNVWSNQLTTDYFVTNPITSDVSVYAKMTDIADYYTVTFDTNGGSTVESISNLRENLTIAKPSDPTKENCEFLGWYSDSSFANEWDFDVDTISENTTLYAKWLQNYSVTYVLNYSGTTNVQRMTINGLIDYVPTRSGYIFNGWYLSEGEINGNYILSEKFDTSEMVTSEGLVLYAEWVEEPTESSQLSAPSVKIEDDMFYWNEVANASGYKVVITKNGSEVDTYSLSDCEWFFPSDLDAGYYVVKICAKGDGYSTVNSVYTSKYFAYNILSNTKINGIDNNTSMLTWSTVKNAENYDLYIDGNLIQEALTSTSYDMTEYSAGTHIIKIVANAYAYASSTTQTQVIKYRLAAPTITSQLDTENIRYVISWDAVEGADSYKIIVEGTEIATVESNSYRLNMNISAWSDKTVLNVEVQAFDSSADYFISINSNKLTLTKLHALVIDMKNTSAGSYEVSSNCVNGCMINGEEYTITLTENHGYTFLGWYENSQLVSNDKTYTFTAQEDHNFEAQWLFYTVTTEKNIADAGTITEYNEKAFAVGDTVNMVATTNEGYQFAGWFNGSTLLSSELEYSFEMTENNFVITAKWDLAPLTIHYIVDGEEVHSHSCNMDFVDFYNYTETGKMVEAWYKEDTLTNKVATLNDATVSDDNVYLYAGTYAGNIKIGFTKTASGYEIDSVQSGTGELVLPSKFNNTNVTSIKSTALNNKSYSSIVIPNTISTLSKGALKGCSNLQSLTLPFVGNKKVSATSSNQYPLGYIFGTSYFASTTSTSQQYLADGSRGVKETETYYIPTSLTTVTITGGTYLPYGAFYNCSNIQNIAIPDAMIAIGDKAVYNTAWLSNQTDGLVALGKVLYSYKGTAPEDGKLVIPQDTVAIREGALSGCSWIKNLTVPYVGSYSTATGNAATLGYIFGTMSASGCDKVQQNGVYYYIPSSLTTLTIKSGNISDNALSNLSKLTTLNLENIGTIGKNALSGCSGLRTLVIPNTVTEIGLGAFSSLQIVELSIPFVGKNLTEKDYQFIQYVFGSTSIGSASTLPSSLRFINVTGNITSIPTRAFDNCSYLLRITLPNTIETIESKAFYNCQGLTEIALPQSLTTIKTSAFSSCKALTTLTIPENVTFIGSSAFYLCQNLSQLTFTDSTSSWLYGSTTVTVASSGDNATMFKTNYGKDYTKIEE